MIKIKYLFFVILLIQSCEMGQKPLVIGHRGAMGHETENTLASVQKAIDLDVDQIEIDVFKIKSGEIVVFHDDLVDRLTDGSGKIEEYTWEELQKLNVKGNRKIPLLQEVLDVIDGKVGLNIELKGTNTAADTDRITKEYVDNKGWKLDDFIISSFNWDELRAMRTLNSEIRIAVLTGKDPLDALLVAKELNAEAINPHFELITRENVLEIKQAGYKIYTWTVNEPEDILSMKRHGVDGIITNFPERAK